MITKSSNVAVVGGGLAGLTASIFLRKLGAEVTVFESADQAGGRARSLTKDGYKINLGPHALYVRGAANIILNELGINIEGGPPPTDAAVAITTTDLFELPLSSGSIFRTKLFSAAEKIEFAIWFAKIMLAKPDELSGTSLAQWLSGVRSVVVRRTLLTIFRLATYASAPELMSAGAALKQLQMSARGVVIYPDGGWKQMVDALVNLNKSVGAHLCLASPVTQVVEQQDHIEIGTRDGSTHRFDHAVLAVTPDAVLKLLGEHCPPGLNEAINQITPVRASCLDVCLSRLPNNSIQFALGIDQPIYFSVHSINSKLAPPGAAVLHVAKYLAPDEAVRRDTEEMLAKTLDRLQPGWRDLLVFKRFLGQIPVAYRLPTWQEEGTGESPKVKVPGLKRICLAGDWIGSGHLLSDCSMASGKEAAHEISMRFSLSESGQRRAVQSPTS
jgi:phytoene dehydrogenase-like protein